MNAQLLGMILVSKIYNSAMGRAKLDPKDRKDFYLYVDEFQNFVSGTFADILSEARKYRLTSTSHSLRREKGFETLEEENLM